MEQEFSVEDALIILQRRLVYFIAPIVVLIPVGLVVIMMLRPMYYAEGRIAVESQQIPEQWVASTVNTRAEERIRLIEQRVLTRNRLLEIADKYNLFPREMGLSEAEKYQRMARGVNIEVVPLRLRPNAPPRPDDGVFFIVGFRDPSPEKAFQVANEIMTLFMSEDVRSRSEGAATTTEFFRQETQRLASLIDQVEGRIADFKAKNANALPENVDLYRTQLTRAKEDLVRSDSQITMLFDQMRTQETQLSTYMAGSGGGAGASAELARLKSQLAALRADRTDDHPDVRALQSQIAVLQRQTAPSAAIQGLRRDLQAADAALAEARAQSPQDPELIKARRAQSDSLRERLSRQISSEAATGSADIMVAQMQGQIDMTYSRISQLQDEAEALRLTVADMEDRIARTPVVERELSALTRDRQNLADQYEGLRTKQQAAELSETLEDDQKAEKFSILEAAQRPDRPISPNRPKLAFMLAFMSLIAGAGLAGVVELVSSSVRGRTHLTSLAGEAPIAVIPYIRAEGEARFNLPLLNRIKPA